MTRYSVDNIILISALAILVLVFYIGTTTGVISVDNIVRHSQNFERFVDSRHLESIAVFALVYVFAVAISLPGTALLTVAGGFMYGTLAGALYSCLAATAGALVAFLAARYVVRGPIERKMQGTRMSRLNNELNSKGPSYLLAMRLTFLPIWFINLCAGITQISVPAFLWTTFIGIIPRTLVYAYTGQQLSTIDSLYDIFTFRVILALILVTGLAVLPIIWQRCRSKVPSAGVDRVGSC